ncbi:hypothetical protein QAD02_008609 [Eretmocerus hayati]|uniref:Uncharacterized protein n=1 Tax=Eretmocerus hayati TaxID=131215 RepID=A0ACC2N718_9HYME|nr:hypothetical protein QAD02_008609 [Eretmocerus hayati]
MEELVDPNLNADAYRNLSSASQQVDDRHLEVVLVYKDESLLVAASNMVDRCWFGTIWYYNDPAKYDHYKYTAAMRTESGVRVADYLGQHDKFVVGEDSGLIRIFEANFNAETQSHELACTAFSCQHDDSLTAISVFKDDANFVSSGMDSCIKVWDAAEMIATSSFHQAQTDIVTCVETQPNSNSVFVSTSMDCEALLWDVRKFKPALGLWKKSGVGLTSVSWKFNDENIVAIGGIDGSIAIIDIRNLGANPLHESIEFPRGVHKLLFSCNNPNQLAGCCDSTEVKVFDTSDNCKTILNDDSHDDFVRGLAWHKSDLITCSWDNTVLRHPITYPSKT